MVNTLIFGITFILWISGILGARRRGISRGVQILFSIIMFGGALGNYLLDKRMLPSPSLAAWLSLATWAIIIIVAGILLVWKRLLIQYSLFATGISLIFFSFYFGHKIRDLVFYPLFGVAFLLVVSSSISAAITLRRRKAGCV